MASQIKQTVISADNFSVAIHQALNSDSFQKILSQQIDNSSSISSEDYVTLDEKNVKEWEFPENIAIPIGNNKVRIKTELFISLLSIFISLIFSLTELTFNRLDASTDTSDSQKLMEIEQERNLLQAQQNEILYNLLKSVDASTSSQADAIEELKEFLTSSDSCIPVPDSVSQTQEVNLDSHLKMTDNTNEYQNSGSEN